MHQYQPTIIETGFLFERLLIQLAFLRDELKQSWIQFKKHPITFSKTITSELLNRLRTLLSSPNFVPAVLTAVAAIICAIAIALLVDKKTRRAGEDAIAEKELVILSLSNSPDSANKPSIGKDGPRRVGFQDKKGEGSGPTPKLAQGGGGGGNHNPIPPQTGKLPPPSPILRAIPAAHPIHPPALPVAGIDIDPALWKDLKTPVYGDPRSKSDMNPKERERARESEQNRSEK